MIKKSSSLFIYVLFWLFVVLSACTKSPPLESEVISSEGPPAAVSDDQKVTISSASSVFTVSETKTYSVVVNFDKPNPYALNLNWNFAEDAAADWTAVSGAVHVPAGSSSATIVLNPINDIIYEPTETYTLNLKSTMALNGLSVPVDLTSDESVPTLALLTTLVNENDTGAMTFLISHPSQNQILIDYSIVNGTATYGTDLSVTQGQTGTVTIPAGATTVLLPWSAIEDVTVESLTETATLTASKNTLSGDVTIPAGLGGGSQVFTVYDNDIATVDIRIASPTQVVTESVGAVSIKIMLNKASVSVIDYAYNIAGTAVSGQDYVAATSGVIRFDPGDIVKTLTIPIINDSLPELSNTLLFSKFLVAGTTNNSGPSSIGFTILDDDGKVTSNMTTASMSVNEAVGTLLVPFAFDRPAGDGITLKYTLSGTALSTHDYTHSVSYVVPAGTTNGTIPIVIRDDVRDESDETLVITLTANANEYIYDLFSVNFDGTGSLKINTAGNQGVRSFSLSANSQKVSWVQELGKTIVANLDGTSQIQIGSADGSHGLSTSNLPTLLFSPNGNYVAACLYDTATSQYHIFSYKTDGTAEVALKNSMATACGMAFTTDSLKLVYTTKPSYYELVSESVSGGVESTLTDNQYTNITILDVGDTNGYLIFKGGDLFSFISSHYKKRKLDGTTTGQIDFTPPLATSLYYPLSYFYDKLNNIFQWSSGAGPYIRNGN